MNDPRLVLKEELISLGILSEQATIIALDAGSSQVIVNKEYLDSFTFSESITIRAWALITKFYIGEFSIEQY